MEFPPRVWSLGEKAIWRGSTGESQFQQKTTKREEKLELNFAKVLSWHFPLSRVNFYYCWVWRSTTQQKRSESKILLSYWAKLSVWRRIDLDPSASLCMVFTPPTIRPLQLFDTILILQCIALASDVTEQCSVSISWHRWCSDADTQCIKCVPAWQWRREMCWGLVVKKTVWQKRSGRHRPAIIIHSLCPKCAVFD